MTLNKGNAKKLDAFEVGNNEVSSDLSWSSSNKANVKVNDSGLVTAVGKGTATITAKTKKFLAAVL